ncbi:Hypothetical predicted protein [Olea europaea subsp. europaea]|uniref:FRIGIDA-like protein n=1 Tax=Olea europaea subsp. europaea TaxID=158383 RepID=A0A8S0R693_OLEEU|nr:Hypothetical predicted protein [Olea europaea subsp. europaea]
MATTTIVDPPPLTADNTPTTATPPPPQQPEDTSQLPEDTSPVANNTSEIPPQSLELQPQRQPPSPQFLDSITELKNLSGALAAFHQCYDDLHNHLDTIKAAILSKLAPEKQDITTVTFSSSPCKELALVSEEKELPKQEPPQPQKSELESLFKMMCNGDLRRYLASNLNDLPKLREEVPKAMKLAMNPAKLVLDCFGKFFLQGSKAYVKDSPMIPAREASVFMLECFLLMMGMNDTDGVGSGVVKIEKEVKEEADNSAVAWRKRLVVEGGLHKACDIDARGLFLFVSCFGIPTSFKKEDIRDLLRASNTKEILGILQRSSVLMNKLSASIDEMMKNKMEVDAVDIVYTFGLQEKFNPQAMLISFLRESKESWKKAKQLAQGSSLALNEANKKQLAALKSVVKCLEKHKIDPAKLLSGWQISSKILTLEKDIAPFGNKTGEKNAQKRTADETDASKRSKTQEAKRPRFTSHGLQQQVAAGHFDSRRNMLDNGVPAHAVNYSVSTPVVYGGPGAGMLPPSGVGTGISAIHGGHLPTGSHAWSGDASLNARYAGQSPLVGLTSLYRPSPSLEGFPGMPNVSSVGSASRGSGSDLYQFADSVVETESYPSSIPPQSISTVPGALPAYHSSYLY